MLTEQTPATRPTLDQAYAHCRRVALGHYENFPVVSWLLPKDLQPHIYALYAYCRGVDDLGDEADGDRLAMLDEWDTELRRAYAGDPRDIRLVALANTVRRFDIPPEPFERLIEANRRDQRITRYQTFEELLDYCSYSANPVGHLVLYVFGYRDSERQRLSDATCTALQLTNMWQDIAHDFAMDRIYIPQEDMERHSVTSVDLIARKATPDVRRLVRYQVRRTREYFREGLPLIDAVDGRLSADLRLFTLGGLAVLDAIKRQRYDVLAGRPALSKADKLRLGVRALLPFRMGRKQ